MAPRPYRSRHTCGRCKVAFTTARSARAICPACGVDIHAAVATADLAILEVAYYPWPKPPTALRVTLRGDGSLVADPLPLRGSGRYYLRVHSRCGDRATLITSENYRFVVADIALAALLSPAPEAA